MKWESHCYCTFVLKYEAVTGETLDFSVPEEPEEVLLENIGEE
jgi:hypothetical protein